MNSIRAQSLLLLSVSSCRVVFVEGGGLFSCKRYIRKQIGIHERLRLFVTKAYTKTISAVTVTNLQTQVSRV